MLEQDEAPDVRPSSRQGRPTIAHRFNGGAPDATTRQVPPGTTEIPNQT